MIRATVGAATQIGNAIGRSGNTENVLDAVLGLLQAEVVSLATVVEGLGGYRLDIGVRAIRGQDMVMRAMANEFGTRHIPERSFIRATLDRNQARYAAIMTEIAEAGLEGKQIEARLHQLGHLVVGDIQRYMTELRHPPNTVSTARQKGSANPLIDTGQLRQSIDYRLITPEESDGSSSAAAP